MSDSPWCDSKYTALNLAAVLSLKIREQWVQFAGTNEQMSHSHEDHGDMEELQSPNEKSILHLLRSIYSLRSRMQDNASPTDWHIFTGFL
jgi:hypothetical protein